MAGSSSAVTSRTVTETGKGSRSKRVEVVLIDWVADDTDGSIPNLVLNLSGYCIKAITNPGSTAPTDSYDITLGDPQDSALDALGGALGDRDTANTEQVYPVVSGANVPVWLTGSYTMTWANNSVNDATGAVQLYIVDSL